VRYYQRRKLLPVPRAAGAVRLCPFSLVQRIGFIKKAQGVLADLLCRCRTTGQSHSCPIIEALADPAAAG
jgi:DNA-binding transcriptional MerR regulator